MLDASISLLDDPIVALATPPGRSALALIRLSGSASDIDRILSKTVVLDHDCLLYTSDAADE